MKVFILGIFILLAGCATSEGGPGFERPGRGARLVNPFPEVIGLNEVDAVTVITEAGWECRVVQRDGEKLAGTSDYCSRRIKLVIRNNKVVLAFVG